MLTVTVADTQKQIYLTYRLKVKINFCISIDLNQVLNFPVYE